MKDIIIYNKFSSVVAAMQSCTDGGCDRFNTFHVGLLSDIQANNVNTEVPASYEFNRKVTETRTDGYSLPILILEPNGETFAKSGGSFQDFQSKKQITLFAGDIYNVGCCGVGNACTERSKMQIIQDLKMMLLALIEEVTVQLELVGVPITIDSIVFSEDIGFNFGNIKLGGVKAELELYYSSCVEICGFEYEEPEPVVCDDGGADLTIECSDCDVSEIWEVEATENNGEGALISVTIGGNVYLADGGAGIYSGNDFFLQPFFDYISASEGITIGYDLTDTSFRIVVVGACCENYNPSDFSFVFDVEGTIEHTLTLVSASNCEAVALYLTDFNYSTPFECCEITLTAVEIGTPLNVDTDVTDYSFDQITWFANAPVVVAVGDTVVFRRRITYLFDCPPTVIAKTVTVLSSCEDLLIE